MTRRARWTAALSLAGLGGLAAVFGMGTLLTAPVPREIGPPPADLGAEPLTIPSASGSTLAAWYVPAGSARRAVVLMHGIRADRTSLVDRARLFRESGYHVLLFDFQAHGESPGDKITVGWRERHDAIAAVRWIRERHPGLPVAVVGQSMGGAAALYAGAELDADALVVESVYGSILEAIANRIEMRLGSPGRWLAPLLTAQMPLRLGVPPNALRPAEAVRQVSAPLLVAGGTADAHAPPEEVRRIHANAPEPKALWLAEGAAHQDLHAFDEVAYRERVLAWLDAVLSA